MQFLSYSTTWRFLGEKRLFSVQNAPPDGEGAFIRRVIIYIICITCSSREKNKVQTIYVCAKCFSYWRLENAGPGSRGTGYGVPGRGKHGVWRKQGVWWKTRVLSGKHGVPFFFHTILSISAWNAFLDYCMRIKHFVRKKTIQEPTCRVMRCK